MASEACIICKEPEQSVHQTGPEQNFRVDCQRCGTYEWPGGSGLRLQPGQPVRLTGFVREQNAAGIIPTLTTDLVNMAVRRPVPGIAERSRRLLTALVEHWGQNFGVQNFRDELVLQGKSYSEDNSQVAFLAVLLSDDGFLKAAHRYAASITPKGYLEAERLSAQSSGSSQGFVAMSFDLTMNDAYTYGFGVGIQSAGYKPLRIDGKEHINSISDEILAEIRRSRFVVADYTLMNNGVYFEAGFAIGLGVPVIPTCRADHLGKLHFDIRHINTLAWDDPAELAKKLSARISAVIGDGPHRQP